MQEARDHMYRSELYIANLGVTPQADIVSSLLVEILRAQLTTERLEPGLEGVMELADSVMLRVIYPRLLHLSKSHDSGQWQPMQLFQLFVCLFFQLCV